MNTLKFPDRERIDAHDKVRGATQYSADIQFPGLLYAMTVPAHIAKGSMTAISTAAATRVRGVVRIFTPADFPSAPPATKYPFTPGPPTLETQIAFRGQPVALVVAQTLEAAIEAAKLIRPDFISTPFMTQINDPGVAREPFKGMTAGNAERALAGAVTSVTAEYVSPAQHHNPMELLSTTAVWANGRLTIYEGSQHSGGVKAVVARTLGIDPAFVDVKSATVGGGFGQKGWVQRQTALVAHAAMAIGKPVKLVMPRSQIFHVATFRPKSLHRIQLGADSAGKMVGVKYDAEQQQSRAGSFPPTYHEAVIRLYGIENYLGTAANIRLDTQPPGHMRAPHAQPSCFALESAVDELAYKLGRDPVAFRMANDTRVDPQSGKPLSSRFLNECLIEGAQRFGWSRRTDAPGSMTTRDGLQIGWGVGCGVYQSFTTAAVATLRIGANGNTRFAVSGHEMGQGMRNAIAAVLTDELKLDLSKLEIVIGDTTAAPQHLTAGSWGTASVVPAVVEAVARMRSAVADLLAGRIVPGNLHQQIAAVKRPFLQVEATHIGPGQNASALERLRNGQYATDGPDFPQFTSMSYIAHFVEVHIEPHTRRVRVPRVVSIADCGRVVSPRTAASQVRGGVVWGLGAALREASEVDPRYGGFLNNDLADYVVPVNADIGEIEVGFIDRSDLLANATGVKGLGEVAMAGASAAIANAIFHATGKRLRELPIRIEDLL